VQNVGKIKVKLHRFLPDHAKLKHVVLARPGHDQPASQAPVWTRSARKASGWYVNLMLDCPDLPEVKPNGKPEVGGDMGLLRLLTLSDGTLIDNPRWLRQSLSKLRRAQRRLARAIQGSRRRVGKRLLVAKLHEHIANIRRDFWHKLTRWLVHTDGLIVLEDLSLDFMLRNRHLSLSAHDAGLGLFRSDRVASVFPSNGVSDPVGQLLDDKAVSAGCQVTTVNPAHTSQRCSGCGEFVEKKLSLRVHRCPNPECLLELDRDVNAARNILKRALHSARIEPSDVNVGAEQPLQARAQRSPRSRRLYATE
jgi:putative transposase